MARGRKTYTPEEKLEIVLVDIEKTKECLKRLEAEKIDLESQIKMKRLEEIEKLMSESGKTFDDLKILLVG